MAKLAELRSLVNLAQRLGQEPSAALLEHVARLEREEERRQQREAEIKGRLAQDLTELFNLKENSHELVQQDTAPAPTPATNAASHQSDDRETDAGSSRELTEDTAAPAAAESMADRVARVITETGVVAPDPVLAQPTRNLELEIKRLEQWVSRIAATGPGSGEVWFKFLNDVNRDTMTSSNDNWVLEYDAASKKVQFTKDIGAIDSIVYNPNHGDNHTIVGTTAWNLPDRTLNIHHPNGVTQQVGQEQYYLVRNTSGSVIANGTFCMFAGAVGTDGEARLIAAPFIANAGYPNLYGMGVATEDIADGDEGFVTVFGKVRGLNTTGSDVGENWQIGNLLYANPSYPGKLSNTKPTAPNNVVPVAALVQRDATAGEIFVRPTLDQKMLYGRFVSTIDQSTSSINTGIAVTFNTTTLANGVSVSSNNSSIYVEESGFYEVKVSFSLSSTNASQKTFYSWFKKNGVDVQYSARRQVVVGNGVYDVHTRNFVVSLGANEHFEIYWAVTDTTISIDSPPSTNFCPAIPSVTCTVTQVAL